MKIVLAALPLSPSDWLWRGFISNLQIRCGNLSNLKQEEKSSIRYTDEWWNVTLPADNAKKFVGLYEHWDTKWRTVDGMEVSNWLGNKDAVLGTIFFKTFLICRSRASLVKTWDMTLYYILCLVKLGYAWVEHWLNSLQAKIDLREDFVKDSAKALLEVIVLNAKLSIDVRQFRYVFNLLRWNVNYVRRIQVWHIFFLANKAVYPSTSF